MSISLKQWDAVDILPNAQILVFSNEIIVTEEASTEEVTARWSLADSRRKYLDFAMSVIVGSGPKKAISAAVKIIKTFSARIQRAARSARSSVRQTFAARKAAKTADSGGGSSDPDGRRPHTETNASKTRLTVSAFLLGGAK